MAQAAFSVGIASGWLSGIKHRALHPVTLHHFCFVPFIIVVMTVFLGSENSATRWEKGQGDRIGGACGMEALA